MRVKQNNLKELISRLQKVVDKLQGSPMINKGFKDRVDQSNLNAMQHYQNEIANFGGGQPIFRMEITWYKFIDDKPVKKYYKQELYQASSVEEAKAACILHNQNYPDLTVECRETLYLRKPINIFK